MQNNDEKTESDENENRSNCIAPSIAFHGNVILCFACMQQIHITHRALLSSNDRRPRSRETNESPKIQKSLHAVITWTLLNYSFRIFELAAMWSSTVVGCRRLSSSPSPSCAMCEHRADSY